MAQQTHQFPVQATQQPYSPQTAQSPAPQLFPPAKRQHLSPNPPQEQPGTIQQNMSQQGRSPQPGSPYNPPAPPHQSPYVGSPVATPQPQSTNPSNFQPPPSSQSYSSSPYSNSPYPNGNGNDNGNANANGNITPSPMAPQSYMPPNGHNQQTGLNQSIPQSPLGFPGQHLGNQQNYNGLAPPAVGTMGPPSKPDKSKEDGLDPMDVLGGTGIDLREEEQYQFQIHKDSFDTQQTGSFAGYITPTHSFTQYPPGNASSFYGAGPANAIGEDVSGQTQEEYEKQAAVRVWNESARELATSRKNELANPFLNISRLHVQFLQHTQKANISTNVDKVANNMGVFKVPENFTNPRVNVQSNLGSDGGFVATSGNFIPMDSLLCDQIALVSIAAKHRIRQLLGEALELAKARQDGSHGVVPDDWADAAAPVPIEAPAVAEDAIRAGWESAISPRTNLRKRSFGDVINDEANKLPTPVSQVIQAPVAPVKFKNAVVTTLRASAQKERELEEIRIKKRNERNARASGDTSRQGSIIPGTPGSIAPESSEKAPTKKEARKKAEAKTSEAASHAAANNTTNKFLGGGGNLFGKGKKRNYEWMLGGGVGSGASTPGRLNTKNLPGTPAGKVGPSAPERLTTDGVRRLGQWREDKDKGQGIQIRDWIYVLERDGREQVSLQKAYSDLDASGPK